MFSRTFVKRYPAGAGLLLLLLAGCQGQQQHGMQFPPAEVSVIQVAARTVPITFTYVGQTAGSREVEVRAQVGGILQQRHYREGSTVKAGATLFTIDPASYQAVLDQAQAELASAQARLNQASRDVARLKPLYADRAVSQKDYDDAVSAEELNRAAVALARARLTQARLNLAYSSVKAPITGIAGRAEKSEGNLISVGADSLLTTMVQTDPMYVNFSLSDNDRLLLNGESQAGKLILPQGGQFAVTLTLADGSTYPIKGSVNFSETRISRETGTIDSRAEFANPATALLPGQFVRVNLVGATRPNAITVPQRAVMDGPTGKFVYVVGKAKDGSPVAEPRPVSVGEWVDLGAQQNLWVIRQGLKAGDGVIVEGLAKLRPGAPVKVSSAPAAAGQRS